MKLVLDTNILVSAFFWGGNPRKVLERSIEGLDQLVVCKEMLDEITRVLRRPKFAVDPALTEYFVKAIHEIAQSVVLTQPFPQLCRDFDDNKILACALAGQVDVIVSGDEDLLVLKTTQNIKILTASEYLKLIERG